MDETPIIDNAENMGWAEEMAQKTEEDYQKQFQDPLEHDIPETDNDMFDED